MGQTRFIGQVLMELWSVKAYVPYGPTHLQLHLMAISLAITLLVLWSLDQQWELS